MHLFLAFLAISGLKTADLAGLKPQKALKNEGFGPPNPKPFKCKFSANFGNFGSFGINLANLATFGKNLEIFQNLVKFSGGFEGKFGPMAKTEIIWSLLPFLAILVNSGQI